MRAQQALIQNSSAQDALGDDNAEVTKSSTTYEIVALGLVDVFSRILVGGRKGANRHHAWDALVACYAAR